MSQTPSGPPSSLEMFAAKRESSNSPPAQSIESDETALTHIKLKGWANNEKFSDITIRYGANGSRAFYGHRIILVSASSWFKRALSGPHFIEATMQEIRLVDDDEEALTIMLEACYNTDAYGEEAPWKTTRPASEQTTKSNFETVIYHILIYEVADKYDASYVRERALMSMKKWLKNELDAAAVRKCLDENGFKDVVDAIYAATGHRISSEPLRKAFISAIQDHASIGPAYFNAPFTGILDRIAQDVPQLGCDMYLSMKQTLPLQRHLKTAIGTMIQAKCAKCLNYWSKSMRYSDMKIHCANCGAKET